jgi:hypothetical protein
MEASLERDGLGSAGLGDYRMHCATPGTRGTENRRYLGRASLEQERPNGGGYTDLAFSTVVTTIKLEIGGPRRVQLSIFEVA